MSSDRPGRVQTPTEIEQTAPAEGSSGERVSTGPFWDDTSQGLRPGAIVAGKYVLEGRIGVGGMGVVHRARSPEGQDVALKLALGLSDVAKERFLRESQLLAKLDSDYIVRHVDHGMHEGVPWLAMEWIAGCTLDDRIAAGPLASDEVVVLATRIAHALDDAHRSGIVHRDVKPANVLLANGDVAQAKLIDFGIARHEQFAPMTATNAIIGTLVYMAPEQARGAPVDARTDLFALGAVLFECLTGVPPFNADQAIAVLARLLFEDAPRASTLAKTEVPEWLDRTIEKLLARNPDQRLRSAAALLARLRASTGSIAPSASASDQSISDLEQRHITVLAVSASRKHAEIRNIVIDLLADTDAKVETTLDWQTLVLIRAATPEEQLRRAALAALAVHNVAPECPSAIASGPAVVAGSGAVGAVIDVVARLLSLRVPKIAVDPILAGALERDFVVAYDGPRVTLEAERPARASLPPATRFTGRAFELSMLMSSYASVHTEKSPQAMLLVADAGIGKSRLAAEFLAATTRQHPAPRVISGRAHPIGRAAPYSLLAQAVRATYEINDEASAARFHAHVCSVVATQDQVETQSAEIADVVLDVCSGGQRPSPRLRELEANPTAHTSLVRIAFASWLTSEAKLGPLLLLFDDLHWADSPSLDVIVSAFRLLEGTPTLLVAMSRPSSSVVERLADVRVHTLRLHPLAANSARELLAGLLTRDLAPNELDEMVRQSAGSPLLIESLVQVSNDGGQRESASTSALAIVQRRFDGLSVPARRMLRAASIVGSPFWVGITAHIAGYDETPDESARALEELASKNLVQPAATSTMAGEQEYMFAHAVLWDAARALLTPGDAAEGHRQTATWLESRGAPALTIAEHYERARLESLAVPYWLVAAQKSLASCDFAQARALAQKVDAHAPQADMRTDGLIVLAAAHRWLGDPEASIRAAEQAFAASPKGSNRWLAALRERCISHQASFSGVANDVEAISPIDPSRDDVDVTHFVMTASVVASCALHTMHPDSAIRLAERVAPWVEHTQPRSLARARWLELKSATEWSGARRIPAFRARMAAHDAFMACGDEPRALGQRLVALRNNPWASSTSLLSDIGARARLLGARLIEVDAQIATADCYTFFGEPDRALERFREIERTWGKPFAFQWVAVTAGRTRCLIALGDIDGARETVANARARGLQTATGAASVRVLEAAVRFAEGAISEAVTLMKEAWPDETPVPIGVDWYVPGLFVEETCVRLAIAAGDTDWALRTITNTTARLTEDAHELESDVERALFQAFPAYKRFLDGVWLARARASASGLLD